MHKTNVVWNIWPRKIITKWLGPTSTQHTTFLQIGVEIEMAFHREDIKIFFSQFLPLKIVAGST